MPNDIILWDWNDRTVHFRDGAERPMTGPEAVNPRITDAETGEEITHVIRYDVLEHHLIRYATRNSQLFTTEETNRFATIGERREVHIETNKEPQKE